MIKVWLFMGYEKKSIIISFSNPPGVKILMTEEKK